MAPTTKLRAFPHHRLAACLSIALSLSASQVHGAGGRNVDGRNGLHGLAQWPAQHRVADVREAQSPTHPAGSDAVVTNCNDSGPGSLRDALAQAQLGQYWMVDLTQLQCSTISLTSGALGLSRNAQDVELFGPSHGSYRYGMPTPTLVIDANYTDRVIVNVYPQVELGLHDLRLRHGRFTGTGTVAASRPLGGCIYSAGYLSLYESFVTSCVIRGTSIAEGGGIYARSGLSLYRSTVANNEAFVSGGYTYGGGVFSATSASIEQSSIANNGAASIGYGGGLVVLDSSQIRNSTISGNTATYAAGIGLFGLNGGTYTHIFQSTISDNQAQGGVGGVESAQTLHVEYSTIASNPSPSATLAGGIELESNVALTLVGTIVAGNGTNDIGGSGTITGGSAKNLVTASTLALPSDTIMLDPQLQPLADNGGLTLTMALSLGSPAIDSGYCLGFGSPGADQRYEQFDNYGNIVGYFQRVVGPCQDIGAFEYGAGDIFANGFD